MTREEERHKAAEKFAFSDKTENPDYYGAMNDFYYGALWADNNPRMFKGQTDKMEEREIAFMDWWLENHKGESPTFADAIAWADKTMVEKACEYLRNHINEGLVIYHEQSWKCLGRFINDFKKAMKE